MSAPDSPQAGPGEERRNRELAMADPAQWPGPVYMAGVMRDHALDLRSEVFSLRSQLEAARQREERLTQERDAAIEERVRLALKLAEITTREARRNELLVEKGKIEWP